ncbi:MAG: hypothetical protein J6W69_05345 [Bacteroidales bacterium]|nr:hypothetical protein [Bacteroidales bacterium]
MLIFVVLANGIAVNFLAVSSNSLSDEQKVGRRVADLDVGATDVDCAIGHKPQSVIVAVKRFVFDDVFPQTDAYG